MDFAFELNVIALPHLIVAVFFLAQGILVIAQNPNSSLNRSFFIFELAVFIWLFGMGLNYLAANRETAAFFSPYTISGTNARRTFGSLDSLLRFSTVSLSELISWRAACTSTHGAITLSSVPWESEGRFSSLSLPRFSSGTFIENTKKRPHSTRIRGDGVISRS